VNFGVVLGAGGAFGWPFHLGVIEGLHESLGCRLADARIVVGTSAGGAIGASVLGGADTGEVLAAVDKPMPTEQMEEMRAIREAATGPLSWLRRLTRPQAPGLIRRGGLIGLVGLAPAGLFPTYPIRRFPVDGFERWPESLWLPAVRLGDGEVVVFGRDRTDVPVIDAVEATAAVPVMFKPKQIGDERFIDGAVASATHGRLLGALNLDLIVISSPMTRPGRGPIRWRARRQLAAEAAALEAGGATVVVISPDAATMAADGSRPQSPDAGLAVVAAARRQTVEALAVLR
jgi:NTE family protein